MSPECKADFNKICPGADVPEIMEQCLTKDMLQNNVSAACKESRPCLVDMFTFCAHAHGPRAHHECVKANYSSFSAECTAKMKKGKHHKEGEDGEKGPFGNRRGPPPMMHRIAGLAFLCLIFAAGVMVGKGRCGCLCCKKKTSTEHTPSAIVTDVTTAKATSAPIAPPQYATLPTCTENTMARPLLTQEV